MNTAYIGIGSNLGDRAAYVNFARQQLDQIPHTQLFAFSSHHETLPVGPQDQNNYINAAAAIQTTLSPIDLLHHLMTIEKNAGRQRREKWGPRTLDLDILLYENLIINDQNLTIPHPHMHQRLFVLNPLSEIAPQAIHPILNKTITQLQHNLTISTPTPPIRTSQEK